MKTIAFFAFFLLFYISNSSSVKKGKISYLFFHLSLLASFPVFSQDNEAVVTIVGNPVDNSNQDVQYAGNNFQQNPPPPSQQQFAPINENIEPTLENGFHMRFQLESPGSVERLNTVNTSSSSSSAPSYSSGSSGSKVKKHGVSMTQRTFNFKKKLKNWLPQRKKKYRPTLCEKFR
jgi:hypothetical protein